MIPVAEANRAGLMGGDHVVRLPNNRQATISIASAATVDLTNVLADIVSLTGTTNVSSFGTAPRRRWMLTTAASLSLVHSAALVCPGGVNLPLVAGDWVQFVSDNAGNAIVVGGRRADGKALLADPVAIIDRAYAEVVAASTITAVIPLDDTIPQNTEGTQVLSVAITPKSATNRIRVRAIVPGYSTVAGVIALFRSGQTDAIAAAVETVNNYLGMNIEVEEVAASTAARTYSVRVGSSSFVVNGTSGGGRLLGGVQKAVLIVEEIKV